MKISTEELFNAIGNLFFNLFDLLLKVINSKYIKYFIFSIVVIIIALIISKIIRRIMTKSFEKSKKYLKWEVTSFKFLLNAINMVILLIAFLFIFLTIPDLRTFGLTMVGSAGILAAFIGLSSREAFSNISSGIFIVIYKPFRVGDIIKVDNLNSGEVEDINLWHTVIKDFSNRRIVMPNSKISSATILNFNLSDEKICNYLEVGISYDSDIDKAIKIIQEDALAYPDFMDNRNDEEKSKNVHPIAVRLISYGESSINLRAYVWAKNPRIAFLMKCDLLKSIKKRFDNEGIEIPFPYRTIVYKKDIENEKKEKTKVEPGKRKKK